MGSVRNLNFFFIVMTMFIMNLVLTKTYLVAATSSSLPPELLALDIADKLRTDPTSLKLASTDYGHIVTETPAAVLYPTSINDVVSLVKHAYDSPTRLHVAAAGRRHSVRGQAMAPGGVVVNMTSLSLASNDNNRNAAARIIVSGDDSSGYYADVGGEEIFYDVLGATLRRGLAPVTWTDYLYVTVGGALSNAGIGGETFRHGPEISNVLELDVITGKGELLTCSKDKNPELFFSVLGGLGQFGIITRARIALAKAPTNVKWVRLLYTDFSTFSKDQETLISENGNKAVSYLEGQLLLSSAPSIWNSSFYSVPDQKRITDLVNNHSIIYCMELGMFHYAATSVDQTLRDLLGGLSFVPGFVFERDVTYTDFLNRVHSEELMLRALGLWEVPHPWLNMFLPASRISDFNSGVFKDIVVNGNISTGSVILVYPMNRNKWDDRTSVMIPEEDVFYTVGFLNATPNNDWEALDSQNKRILEFCETAGIKVNQYLSHHETHQDWAKHFGAKWATIQQRKAQFDPKHILSPGQKIFN